MAKLIRCKTCGQPIAKSAKICPHCGARNKPSALRVLIGTIILFAGIILIASALATPQTANKTVAHESSEMVTLENFNKIDSTMTYADVCALFGKDGTLDSEVNVGGITTQMYHWYDKSGIANCNVTFQNGVMAAKAQFGLK